ncbi:LysE family transporter [Oscillatoria sp. CS-180]|uniref:LysE family transporter n=1 Tax=Oscillatoria sp. CS-180 TaxID=3021720 RepID=UPI00232F9BD4|nr:LysE family transporter [Oscillatoria sp. CS-180]MDB9528675.1 LysE family transporter [Oscillatoria sp. CS-180]
MQFLGDWLTIFVAGCLVIMTPGPNFFLTIRNSVTRSRQAGIFTAAGIAIGDCTHIGLWLVGIGVLISKSILLFNVIKWLGAAYLIVIGIQSLKAEKRSNSLVQAPLSPHLPSSQAGTAFRSGLITCLLNPKVTLFFLALFTQIIRPGTPLIVQIIYGCTIVGIELCWLLFVATVVSQGTVKRTFLSISHWFERIMGTVLIFFGIRLAIAQATND